MKRFTAVILILALCLSLVGCGKTVTDPPEPTPVQPSVPEKKNTDANTFETEIKELEPFKFESGKRLNKEFTDTFTPGDYGKIYPFAGGMLYESYNGEIGEYYKSPIIGLCNDKGEIVVDPVYRAYNTLYLSTDNHGYYILAKNFSEEEISAMSPDREPSGASIFHYTIVRDDGKCAVELNEGLAGWDFSSGAKTIQCNYYKSLLQDDGTFSTEEGKYCFDEDLNRITYSDVQPPHSDVQRIESATCPHCHRRVTEVYRTSSKEKHRDVYNVYVNSAEQDYYLMLHRNCADGLSVLFDAEGNEIAKVDMQSESEGSFGGAQKGDLLFLSFYCYGDASDNVTFRISPEKEVTVIPGRRIFRPLYGDKYYGIIEDEETGVTHSFIYDDKKEIFTPINFLFLPPWGYMIGYSGYSETLDKDGNLIFRYSFDGA